MKKKNILNLIKYHVEQNDMSFRAEAYEIAKFLYKQNDIKLAEYIMALLSDANTLVPQINEDNLSFLKRLECNTCSLPLPEVIKNDIVGIVNAIGHNVGVNKFLFEGAPGTGKTETVKHLARILDRDLFSVEFSNIVDSKLGQTTKNIVSLFEEIKHFPYPDKIIILFDEIDALALDRLNPHDLREMGRATSALLKGFDEVDERLVIVATTNLFSSFDKALIRRFDAIINFNRYSQDDLLEIANMLLTEFLQKIKHLNKNSRLFNKIISLLSPIPYPGELKNLIKSAVAFSDPSIEYDYLRRLFRNIADSKHLDLKSLKDLGFTLRETEILTGISKSQVARELKE